MGVLRCRRPSLASLALVTLGLAGAGCATHGGVSTDPVSEDQRITSEVTRVVGEIDDVVMEDLRVETRDGVVVVSGVQPSLEVVREILRRAARVRGVSEVVNRIRIAGGPPDQPSQILTS